MIKQSNYVFLPKRIIRGVESLGLSNTLKNHSYKFIATLIAMSYEEHNSIDRFVSFSRNLFVDIFSNEYMNWLKKLKDEKIILSNNSYDTNSNLSKHYSINLNYNTLSLMCPVFDRNTYESVSYVSKKREKTEDQIRTKKRVLEDLNKLKIDVNGMMEIVNNYVDSISKNDFRINENILLDNILVGFTQRGIYKEVRMSKKTALSRAEEWGLTLIQDDNRFFIMDFDRFIVNKKEAVYLAYKSSVAKFEKKIFFGKRNTTNNRLDSNITSMANILTDKICKDNNLVKFDLCNAQFAILSHLFENEIDSDDFRDFMEKSNDGTLYEYIQENLNLKSRKEAKTMMFELMFSSEKYRSSLKKQLKTLFPSVVEKVDAFKKEYGYPKFSIGLQKKESEMFIDGIWKKMKGQKMFCITKHDCLIVKEKDADKTLNIIQTYFDKIGFKGKMIRE